MTTYGYNINVAWDYSLVFKMIIGSVGLVSRGSKTKTLAILRNVMCLLTSSRCCIVGKSSDVYQQDTS